MKTIVLRKASIGCSFWMAVLFLTGGLFQSVSAPVWVDSHDITGNFISYTSEGNCSYMGQESGRCQKKPGYRLVFINATVRWKEASHQTGFPYYGDSCFDTLSVKIDSISKDRLDMLLHKKVTMYGYSIAADEFLYQGIFDSIGPAVDQVSVRPVVVSATVKPAARTGLVGYYSVMGQKLNTARAAGAYVGRDIPRAAVRKKVVLP